jgi:hypothetical protein
MEVNNSLHVVEPTYNGWLTQTVLFQRSSAIWLERLSRLFSHPKMTLLLAFRARNYGHFSERFTSCYWAMQD